MRCAFHGIPGFAHNPPYFLAVGWISVAHPPNSRGKRLSMSNYHRAYFEGGIYFFTVVTLNRAPIFTSEDRVEVLRQAFRKVKATRPFEIDAMVIMPEHLHCIWRLPEGDADYSSRWREIKKAASRQISAASNQRNERTAWQRRFWEHVIRDEKDWRRHMDYIHFNPVKHGLANSPGQWAWSSFSRAVSKGWYDATWVQASPQQFWGWIMNDGVIEMFGGCATLSTGYRASPIIHPTTSHRCLAAPIIHPAAI